MRPLPLTGNAVFAAAKHRHRRSVDLDCTPERLFDVFEDADAWPRWVPAIERVEWTSPPPVGVGTTRTVFMRGGVRGDERFTAYERGRHMQFVFTHLSVPALDGFGEDYRVEDLGAGRCRLTWTLFLQPKGVTRVTMPLAAPLMPVTLDRMLRKLQQLVAEYAPA